MAARIGAPGGDGGGAVNEWAIWRLGLGDHRDWRGIALLHGRAESISRSWYSGQRLDNKGIKS